jgi:tryptophan 7-halogenase
MPDNAPLSEITIVGGGTAGWMTAALLSHLFNRKYRIRLIESDEIGIIGVGEATIPAIKTYNQLAGIDEAEFVKATKATFKLGIRFVNWGREGADYIHGFGNIGQDLLWLHTHQFWLKMAARGLVKPFDNYAINCVASRLNKFAQPDKRNPNSPLADLEYAYHFDASLFGAYLRQRAEKQGVERVEGRIVEVDRHPETGFVERVRLVDGRTVGGDLFVDCSGIRALLIGEALGVGYDDWNEWLLCDRALAVPCENAPALTPYTTSTAHASGWQWRIPLQHRLGNGMVYSSAHLDDDRAAELLLANLDGAPLKAPALVRFRPGKRRRAWDKNVVAIGLSSGFLEPLESTSIHLIQTGIFRLIALFPGAGFNAADVAEYNRQTDFEYTDVRDFIIAHYKVTERQDSNFWRHLRAMSVPDSLAERLALFTSSARFFMHGKAELFREESWVQVLIGQGVPAKADPMVELIPDEQALGYLRDIEEVIADTAAKMLDHADFISRIGQPPKMSFSASMRV